MTRYLASSPEYFTLGKANVATGPLRVRCKHAVSQCMLEAGLEPPRWLHADPGEPDTYLIPLHPKGMTSDHPDAERYSAALIRAIEMTIERIGWPSGTTATTPTRRWA